MIKIENIDVWGFEHAIRGMRNPMNSWDKSDSYDYGDDFDGGYSEYGLGGFSVGTDDLSLMKRLYKAGTEHRKYLRQIFVSMDITAPLYWWKEFDTYKIGTVANSCSTMHKIASKEFELDDFSHEHLIETEPGVIPGYGIIAYQTLVDVILTLNKYRDDYLKTKDKKYWWQLIQLLPSSYNQKRTITINYENVGTIIKQRTGHKLDEWNNFVDILKSLPYIEEIMGND